VVAPPIRTAAITANEDFFNGIGQKQNFKLMRRAHGISAARAAALPIRRLPKP